MQQNYALLVIILVATIKAVLGANVNVLALGYFSRPTSTGLQWFSNRTATLTAVFPIAIKHFNDRDGRIISDFATRQCDVSLKLVEYADDEGSPAPAMRKLVALQSSQSVDVILGPARSAVAQPIAVTASALEIPVISHWATLAGLADKQTYEFFTRTCPSDDSTAVLLADLLRTFRFRRLGMLYVNDQFGTGWRNALSDACEAAGINLTHVAYDDATGRVLERAIDSAMAQLQRARLNVIFFVIGLQAENLFYLASAARKLDMLTKENLYIHTLNDPNFADVVFPESVGLLREFLHGSLSLVNTVPGLSEVPGEETNEVFANFARLWPTFNETEVNLVLPPANPRVSNGERFSFPENYFETTTGDIFNAFTWAYDAVAAAGFAACRLVETGQSARNGSAYLEAIRDLSFRGVSGDVRFNRATGDRDPRTSVYVLRNLVQAMPGGNVEAVPIGMYLPSGASWNLNLSTAQFRDGTNRLTTDVRIPNENLNLLPTWAKVLGYVEVSLGLCFGLSGIAWLRLRRREIVVIESQPVFMAFVALGTCLLSVAIVPLTIEYSDAACMAFPFLFTIGLVLASSAIGAKSWRVGRLWYRKVSVRNDRGVVYLLVIGCAVIINLILLLVWNAVAPLVYSRNVVSRDVNGLSEASYGSCTAKNDTSFVFLGLQVAIVAVIIIGTGLVSFWVYNAPEKFQDTRFTAIAAFCLAQLYLLGVPIVVITYSDTLPRFLVMSTLTFLTALLLFGFLFLPKMVRAREDRKHTMSQQSGSQVGSPTGTKRTNSPPPQTGTRKKIFLRFSPAPALTKQRLNPRQAPQPMQSPEGDERDVRSKAKAQRSDFAAVADGMEHARDDVKGEDTLVPEADRNQPNIYFHSSRPSKSDGSNIATFNDEIPRQMTPSPSRLAHIRPTGNNVFSDDSTLMSSLEANNVAVQRQSDAHKPEPTEGPNTGDIMLI